MVGMVAKQPNGLFCRFSSVADMPTHWNLTKEDYIEYCRIRGGDQGTEYAKNVLKHHLFPFETILEETKHGEDCNMSDQEFEQFLKDVNSFDLEVSPFDVKKTIDECVTWIRDFFKENGDGCNAIIGISGGKDSSVVSALCVKALGNDRVIGVLMPNGEQKDIDYAYSLVEILDIPFTQINIENSVNGILDEMGEYYTKFGGTVCMRNSFSISEQTKINLPARIRMSTLYAVAQSCNGRVANTCNLSEDYIGYSTRYGDSAGDFSPLANLTSDEIIAMGIELGLPEYLVKKPPSDGLCGKTDEDNFGFTYSVLNKYIRTGICEDKKIKRKIDEMHKKNLFKLQLMPCFPYRS